MLFALVLLPALGALGAYALRGGTRGAVAYRTAWLVGVAALHVVLVADAWIDPPAPVLHGWLALDALGLVVLTTVSGLFAVVTVSAVGYLRHENPRGVRQLPARVPGQRLARLDKSSSRAPLGGDGGDHAGARAADFSSP